MKTIENLCYANDDASQALDIYLPEASVESVFLYFHGGGLERGDKSRSAVFAPYLTATQAIDGNKMFEYRVGW